MSARMIVSGYYHELVVTSLERPPYARCNEATFAESGFFRRPAIRLAGAPWGHVLGTDTQERLSDGIQRSASPVVSCHALTLRKD